MPVLDTSAAALALQREAFRRMTPQERVAAAAEMSDDIRRVTEAGIRHRHPGYSDDEVGAALALILLGPAASATGPRARRTTPEA